MKDKNIYGFMVSEKPLEEYFDYVLSHGIRHLELDLRRKHARIKTFTPGRIDRVREYATSFFPVLSPGI